MEIVVKSSHVKVLQEAARTVAGGPSVVFFVLFQYKDSSGFFEQDFFLSHCQKEMLCLEQNLSFFQDKFPTHTHTHLSRADFVCHSL